MSLLSVLASLETDVNVHLTRLLVLLGAFGKRDGNYGIDGLGKLAKLDFFLRYPVYLERAVSYRGGDRTLVQVQAFERQSVESRMVRFKYGPWDYRYRIWLGVLLAKDLVEFSGSKRGSIALTATGKETAELLRTDTTFHLTAHRAKLLKRYLDLSDTNLMHFVYRSFPEVASLHEGEAIHYGH